jgi:hypothetical protein
MRSINEYPATVQEILDDKMKFRSKVLKAVRRFARSHPWQGSHPERRAKFEQLLDDLSALYGIARPRLVTDGLDGGDSSRSCYIRAFHTIILRGKLSILTLLHEIGHALGKDEYQATKWSVNLFRVAFPRSFARCRFESHLVRAPLNARR